MYVYILISENYKKTYTGINNNISRLLLEHNFGKHVYTTRYKPWKIIYKEKVENRKQARKREKYFKSSARRRWLKKYVFNKI